MTISNVLNLAAELLDNSGIVNPRREASSLLAFVLQKPAPFVIAHPDYELNETESTAFDRSVRRRAGHEPFQYITGRQEFFGLDFGVTPDVLIPRPETEILVEAAIDILSALEAPQFCEIGVGSGCISVSILDAVMTAAAVGTDISTAAIRVADANAEIHGVGNRLTIREGSAFAGLTAAFDLIVSNPPYVPEADIDHLQREVRDFEPRAALAGGASGLEIVEQIVDQAPRHLRPNGWLLMEIGFNQAERVRELFRRDAWARPDFLPDLQGIPRIVKVRLATD